MALKLYKKKTIDIWITHICLYVISSELANVLGTWTVCSLSSGEIAAVKFGHRRYQHCQFLLVAKAYMHEMATRRNDKSPSVLVWLILLSSATTNQADVMSDADCTLNVQGIVISTLPSSLSEAPLQKTCGLKKRKDIRRYNWYTHNEMQTI